MNPSLSQAAARERTLCLSLPVKASRLRELSVYLCLSIITSISGVVLSSRIKCLLHLDSNGLSLPISLLRVAALSAAPEAVYMSLYTSESRVPEVRGLT